MLKELNLVVMLMLLPMGASAESEFTLSYLDFESNALYGEMITWK